MRLGRLWWIGIAALFVVVAIVMVKSAQRSTGGLDLKRAAVDARSSDDSHADIPVGAATIIKRPKGKQFSAMPWKFQALSADGRTITIVYVAGDGDCTKSAGVTLVQTSSLVAISPYSINQLDRSACPSMLQLARVRVVLSQPLGSRRLLHPEVDPAWQQAARSL